MRTHMWTAVLLAAALLTTGEAQAQQQPAAGGNPLDVVPDKMPFNTPYGTPISLEKAQAAVQAAVAEANKGRRFRRQSCYICAHGGSIVRDRKGISSLSVFDKALFGRLSG
jgi:glc operon protein GlcG